MCVGLFVYLCYRIEESWVHRLVLKSLKAPPGRTDTTQAPTSVVHRRESISGKKGSMGSEERPEALWKCSPAL